MKNYIFFLLSIVAYGCNNKTISEQGENVINIELQKNIVPNVNLSDIAIVDSIKVLDVGEFKDFGGVTRAFWVDNMLLLHSNSPTTLTLLDNSYKVVKQIAPDHLINDFTSIDTYKNNIYILDRPEMSIYVYDKYLSKAGRLTFPFYAQSFKILTDSIVAFYTGNEKTEYNNGKLVLYNYLTNMVSKDLLPISELQRKYFNFMTKYHFEEYNGSIIYWDSSINTIYSVNSTGITPIINLDYGKYGVPEDFYNTTQFENAYDFITQMRKLGYAFRHFQIFSNKNHILIIFEKDGDFYTSLYSSVTNTTQTFKEINDDLIFYKKLEDLKLSYFVCLYGERSFISFIPFEFLEDLSEAGVKGEEGINEGQTQQQNLLLFGTLKNDMK